MPTSVNIFSENSSNCIPVGNDNYAALIDFIESEKIRPCLDIKWAQVVRDDNGSILYYKCNLGNFVDNDNVVSNQIRQGIESGNIELQESASLSPVVAIEASVFLSRNYTLSEAGARPIDKYEFSDSYLGLPFQADVLLLQSIEEQYFDTQTAFIQKLIKNTGGNVIRIGFKGPQMRRVLNWSKPHLGRDLDYLSQSMQADIALHKRSKRKGVTTNWYFDWMSLQMYIWAPILEVANLVIGLINHQAHRKTTALLSKDDLGDVVCIKSVRADGACSLWPLSNLRDEQIHVFPSSLNWEHKLLDRSFNRIRYLLDRRFYFESIVIAQATLEAIINGMFPVEIKKHCFGKDEIRWEQKYKELRLFFEKRGDDYFKKSALYSYLDGGLHRIYQLRNGYVHDIFDKQPVYDFKLSELREISQLLKPFTELHDTMMFMSAVDAMYRLRPEFLKSLIEGATQSNAR